MRKRGKREVDCTMGQLDESIGNERRGNKIKEEAMLGEEMTANERR